jgi:hypothetical protein
MSLASPKWRLAGGIGAFVIVGSFILDALHPDYEILYEGSFVTSACPEVQGKKLCVGVYQLAIANSGEKRQEEVRLLWSVPLDKWTVKVNPTDLVASTKRSADPVVAPAPEPGRGGYLIANFEPNTVLEFKFTCAVCSLEDLQALKDAQLKVTAKGTVTETEPRWTIFGRAMRNLQRVVRLML